MNDLTLKDWIAILCLGLIVLIPNLLLLSILLQRKVPRLPIFRTPWKRMIHTVRQPWREEDAQLSELSQRVQEVKKNSQDSLTPPQ